MGYADEVRLSRPIPESSYLRSIPAVRALMEQPLVLDQAVTILMGENGTGKSTLLEGIAVACGFNPEGGTRNFNFSTRDTHSPLGDFLTIVRRGYARDGFFLRAESLYNVASNIDEMDEGTTLGPQLIHSYGGVSLHGQSHGESFLAMVRNRFGGDGLYLLDEPEAALSPARQLELLLELRRLAEQNSQIILATHSPILMAYPGARVYQLSDAGICPVDYRTTEHYQIMRRFLDDPEGMLAYLFAKEER